MRLSAFRRSSAAAADPETVYRRPRNMSLPPSPNRVPWRLQKQPLREAMMPEVPETPPSMPGPPASPVGSSRTPPFRRSDSGSASQKGLLSRSASGLLGSAGRNLLRSKTVPKQLDGKTREQYGALLSRGSELYQEQYTAPSSPGARKDYKNAIAAFREAIALAPSEAAAHFALAVAYKASRQPMLGAEAACDALDRCASCSETWADAAEIAYSCVKGLHADEIRRLQLTDRCWWWSDESLLSFSQQAVRVNVDDARAWRMRAEVLCALFGEAPWANVGVRSSADFCEAGEAFRRAARITDAAEWERELLVAAERCDAAAGSTAAEGGAARRVP